MLTLEQRLAGLPTDTARQVVAVIRAVEQRRIDDAEHGLGPLLATAPTHPEVLRLSGVVHSLRGRVQPAIAALSAAAERRPDDALIFNGLAGVYESINDADRSRQALRRACELGPDFAPPWANYGWRLFVDGDVDAAVVALRRAVTLAPHDAQARTLLADALTADGDSAGAATEYRRIIAANPAAAAQAWWSLATLKPAQFDAADVDTLRTILGGSAISAPDRTTLGCALAMALEQQGDFAGAFAALHEAHAQARRLESYDAAAFGAHVDAVLAAFAPPPAGADAALGEAAIFIVSMPRSGSTLTEQILAAHSQVAGAGERPDLAQLIMDESRRERAPLPDWARRHTPAQWRALGERYLERAQRWRRSRPRFTDKAPANWLYVGAILAMLPRAKVIVVRRDPLETCLACYRYMFRRHAYTHVFTDLARRWHDFARATQRWHQLHPGRVYALSYEALLADADAQIRDLLAFCELPFEDACLNFHSSDRRVATPSATQVREPLRRDTARADKYGSLLDPLRQALNDVVAKDPPC